MRRWNWVRLLTLGVMVVLLLSLFACGTSGGTSSAPAGDSADLTTTTSSATTTKKIPTTVKHNVNDTETPSTTSTTAADILQEWLRFRYPDGSPAIEADVWWTNADGSVNEEFEDGCYVTNEKGMLIWSKSDGPVKGAKFHVGFIGDEDKYHVSEFTTEKTENEIIYTFILK